MVICLERIAYGLADATATPSSLLQEIQNSLSFWYRPTQVVLEKKAIKRLCVCMCIQTLLFNCFAIVVLEVTFT